MNNLTFKIQFLSKEWNFKYDNLFLNHSIYFNICSVDFLNNSDFFTNFCKLLTLKHFKLMKYQFFNIFIIPTSYLIDNFIIKVLFDSQLQTLLKSTSIQKQKILNSDSLIVESYKIFKKDFFIKNLSIYDEANEILWQKFWKTCHCLAYKTINQKLRKVINKIITETRNISFNTFSVFKFLKNFIKKTKIFTNLNFNLNNLKSFTKNKFSLFINFLKIYFKKTLSICYMFPKSINEKKTFFRFQKDLLINNNLKPRQNSRLKKLLIKLISLKLLPWILSEFIITSKCFLKFKKLNYIFSQENVFRNNNQIQYNLIKKIKKNSFLNFQIQAKKLHKSFSKSFFNSSTIDYYKLKKIIQEFSIYKNQINSIIKHKKLKLFMNTWFVFFKKKQNNSNKYFRNFRFNNICFKNIQSLNILFYQKKWLLKKKNILTNYTLLKNLKYNISSFLLKYKINFIKLIYSSIYKNNIFISILSLQIKKFYKVNLIQNIQNYYHAIQLKLFQSNKKLYSRFNILHSNNYFFKQFNYIYSFILFSSKDNNCLTNNRLFFNIFYFLKFAKKNILKKFSWLTQIQKNFYSTKIFKYQKKQQENSMLKFIQKKIFFYKLLDLMDLIIFYYRKKILFIKFQSVIKLILQKKICILFFVKRLQMRIINQIQKYYFYESENNKIFQIKVNINNLKNLVIFMNAKKKKHTIEFVPFLFQRTIPLFYNKYKSDRFLNCRFTKFLFLSKFWQIIINLVKNRINKYESLTKKFSFRMANNTFLSNSSIINLKKEYFLNELYFNSFLMKFTFSNIVGAEPLINIIKQKKKKIIQTCEQYSKNLKLNSLFFINYLKINWNHSKETYIKNKEFGHHFLFFRNSFGQSLFSYNQSKNLTKNNDFVNFYLKFIKHDLNKIFNEVIFSVISESKKDSNDTLFWNNIYSLSNRYSWKSDVELNIFLCYMLSPENPSDILIPLYKQRIHSSNVLREEPPIAGGGIILKLLKELDLPEMKKIDIQLQTILKKIPNKLHEIEVLLKHYQTNMKFLKYYSLKRRTLIEIEKSILRKLKYIRRLNWVSAKPEYMIIRNLPVLPADLRPIFKIQQQLTASDLNRLYQKVMYRNDRLKRFLKNSTTSNSFEMFFAQHMLQGAVDNLIENGKDMNSIEMDSRGRPLKSLGELLKGKKGRFRQNLLGKRVDYSGRSVIVVGPKLRLHECGLPIEMAVELFLPFLIKEILRNKYALTVRSAKLYIKKHRIEITQLLRQIVKKQPILLNRAPTLHRLGIQAFLPKLVEGKAILLHPLVCSAFNADFDGDQMAVHVPITNEARIEAWKLILSRNNLLSPATGEPVLLPSQDMVLGCYYLTIENSQSLLKKQKKISGINQNIINNVFNSLENIFIAYQRNQIHLHTNIWVKFNNNIESDAILQKPTEIQVQFRGQYTKIYSDHYHKLNKKGELYNQFIRTTPGRILFNLMLNNCLN
nr:RNA polymerase beta' subunit [Oedogonium sp. HN1801B]